MPLYKYAYESHHEAYMPHNHTGTDIWKAENTGRLRSCMHNDLHFHLNTPPDMLYQAVFPDHYQKPLPPCAANAAYFRHKLLPYPGSHRQSHSHMPFRPHPISLFQHKLHMAYHHNIFPSEPVVSQKIHSLPVLPAGFLLSSQAWKSYPQGNCKTASVHPFLLRKRLLSTPRVPSRPHADNAHIPVRLLTGFRMPARK